MISTLILSKDRPAQIDLLLQSLQKNAPNLFDITVIYDHSNDEFAKGYDILRKYWPEYLFVKELPNQCSGHFYNWLKLQDYIYNNKNYLTTFFSDDCIFYRKNAVGENELLQLFGMQNMWLFTYRLGDNITVQDYTIGNATDRPRVFAEKRNSVFWDYRQVNPSHSFGWPVGFDGHVWRTEYLKKLLCNESFDTFPLIEGLMINQFKKNPPSAYLMSSPLHSSVVVQQVNVTHNRAHNNIGKFIRSCKSLNDEFLQGKRASLSSMDFSNINCTHSEIPFTME